MTTITDERLSHGRWLRIPGPTPVPPEVLAAMAHPMIPHRGPEIAVLLQGLHGKLRTVMRTEAHVGVWAGSGSAGWEAALQNTCQAGDRVVATVCGDFGARFAAVARRFGLEVDAVEVAPGRSVSAEMVAEAIERGGPVRAVLVTHNETSTGVTNPLAEIAVVARAAGALVLVDAVSSAAAMPVEADAWDLDWVVSGSQKAWMCPPGLMLASISERALHAARERRMPRSFWDAEAMVTGMAKGLPPTTPPIPMLWALDVAVDLMLTEGVEAMWGRQRRLGESLRSALMSLGLELYAERGRESASLTAVRPPAGLPASALQAAIQADSGIAVAIGQAEEREAVIRIGHMGWTQPPELVATVESLARVLARQEARCDS